MTSCGPWHCSCAETGVSLGNLESCCFAFETGQGFVKPYLCEMKSSSKAVKGCSNDERKDIFAFSSSTGLPSTLCCAEWKALSREVFLGAKGNLEDNDPAALSSMGW